MDFEEYYIGSLKTEKMDYDTVRSRLNDDHAIRLLHATLGLGSEIAELMTINPRIENAKVNIAEEIGDIYWFSVLAIDAIDCMRKVPVMIPWLVFEVKQCLSDPWEMMNKNIERIQSDMKAFLFYGRKLELKKLIFAVSKIIDAATSIGHSNGLSQKDIMKINRAKLQKRYASLEFSENSANNRNKENEFNTMTQLVDTMTNKE